jgi:hypothetical protein
VVTIEALSQALGRAGRQLRAAAQDLGIKPPALEGRADDDGGIKRHPNYYFGFDENNKWVGLPNTGKPQ